MDFSHRVALHAISAETGGAEILKTRLEERDTVVKGRYSIVLFRDFPSKVNYFLIDFSQLMAFSLVVHKFFKP